MQIVMNSGEAVTFIASQLSFYSQISFSAEREI